MLCEFYICYRYTTEDEIDLLGMCSLFGPRFKALPFADDHLKTAIH